MEKTIRSRKRMFIFQWVIFSGIGLGGGLALGLGIAEPVEAIVGMMLVTPFILFVAGFIFGAAQWVALLKNPLAGLLWVAGSVLGIGIGMTLGVILIEVAGMALTGTRPQLVLISPLGRFVALSIIGVITGLTVGLAQWAGVRKYLNIRWQWILWSVFGFGVGLPTGGLVTDLFVGGLQSVVGFSTFLVVSGLLVGLLTVKGASKIGSEEQVQAVSG